jgi:hypothetical protein
MIHDKNKKNCKFFVNNHNACFVLVFFDFILKIIYKKPTNKKKEHTVWIINPQRTDPKYLKNAESENLID